MAGSVEAAPAETFILRPTEPRSPLLDRVTSPLGKPATSPLTSPPIASSLLPNIGSDDSQISFDETIFDRSPPFRATTTTESKPPSFASFPPPDASTLGIGAPGEATATTTLASERRPPLYQSRPPHSSRRSSSLLVSPPYVSPTESFNDATRPRLMSLTQPTPLPAYHQQELDPYTASSTTIPRRGSQKRHSISVSATASLLQAASAASSLGSGANAPPGTITPTKSLFRSATLQSPKRPPMVSAATSPSLQRARTISLRSQTGHLTRGDSSSAVEQSTGSGQYISLQDAARREELLAEVRPAMEPGAVPSARRSSFGGQKTLGGLSGIEPIPEGQLREPRTVPRSAALQCVLEAKLVILGSQGVGKTSLAYRYASGQFNPSVIPSTIGAAFLTKKLTVDNVKCRLQLWDTSGQEKWRAIAPMYYRGSNAALLVYDITSRRSFEDLKYWIEELNKNMGNDLVIHVVGSKLDLAVDAREVDPVEAKEQILQWLCPERAGALAASQSSESPVPPTAPAGTSSSRLGSLGSLAMGSASRLATAFPSTGRSGISPLKSSSDGSGSGEGSEGAGDTNAFSLPGDDANIELSEVSSKDDRGIEEVFLAITQKLVLHREEIEQRRLARERNSIFLHTAQAELASRGDEGRKTGANGYSCC